MRNKNRTLNLVLFASFTALCYVGTFIMIPLPTGDKIHLGNLVCILASLLFGGLKGGLIGSLGMGLNDLHFYLDTPSTIIRTLILKFLMGLIVGLLFNLFKKKQLKSFSTNIMLYLMALLFKVVFVISLIYALDASNKVSILVPIVAFIFSELFILALLFFKDKEAIYKYVLLSVSVGTIFNIVMEFFFRIFLNTIIDGFNFNTALTLSIAKLPASILTGTITVVASVLVYPLLSKALGKEEEYNG